METTHKYFISEYIVTVNINMRHLNNWIFECFPIEIAYNFWGGRGVSELGWDLKKNLVRFIQIHVYSDTLQYITSVSSKFIFLTGTWTESNMTTDDPPAREKSKHELQPHLSFNSYNTDSLFSGLITELYMCNTGQ